MTRVLALIVAGIIAIVAAVILVPGSRSAQSEPIVALPSSAFTPFPTPRTEPLALGVPLGTPEAPGMNPTGVPGRAGQSTPPSVGEQASVTPGPSTHELVGVRATWFATGPDGMFAAAGPALRVGDWRGRIVRVCTTMCIRVTLDDWCQCSFRQPDERAIDLSDQAFALLSPLSRGVLHVTVTW